jgi:hypothetical protein
VAVGGPKLAFPDDLSVTVTREGNKPVKIDVRQGDKNWQVTGDDLAKLPEKVRPHIEAMLGNMGSGPKTTVPSGTVQAFPVPEVEIQGSAEGPAPSVQAAPPAAPPPAAAPAAESKGDRGAEIDQLRGQLKDLQRRLDQLGNEKKQPAAGNGG